jgi:hypothetical protein
MKVQFIVGHKYKVLKPGVSISYDYPAGPSVRKSATLNLKVNDAIEYVGYLKGSDGFPGEWFKYVDVQGDLYPNSYGMIQDHDLLEDVSEAGEKRKGPLYPHVTKGQTLPSESTSLTLVVGNKRYPVESLKDASIQYRLVIRGFGVSEIPAKYADPLIYDQDNRLIGHIAFNGRVFPGTGRESLPGGKYFKAEPLYDSWKEGR